MRDLRWHGYFNARDLGGLPTPLSPTGSTILKRIARGPRRELLTGDGWEAARHWPAYWQHTWRKFPDLVREALRAIANAK